MTFTSVNINTLPETNVDWYANGEEINAVNLNRPIKDLAQIINDNTAKTVEKSSQTGEIIVPAGTTAQAGAGASGHFRFNTDLNKYQGFISGSWRTLTEDETVSIITGATNAAVNNRYFCNTTSAAFTVTLPASPSVNDVIKLHDYAGTFATNNLTVGRNGNNIMGLGSDLVLSTGNANVILMYVDVTQGWRIV